MITLSREQLVKVLSLVDDRQKAVTKTTIEAKDRATQVKHFNPVERILTNLTIPAQINEPLEEISVSHRILLSLAQKIDRDSIEITTNESEIVINNQYKILRESNIMPTTTPAFEAPPVSLNTDWLKFCLKIANVIQSSSPESGTPSILSILNGIYLKIIENKIITVSASNYCLAKSLSLLEEIQPQPQTILVPMTTANQLLQILTKTDTERLELIIGSNQAQWIFDNGYIVSNLMDAEAYPNVDKFTESIPENTNIIDTQNLIDAIERMLVVVTRKPYPIKFEFLKTKLRLSPAKPEEHMGEEIVEIEESSGMEQEIWTNGELILKVLKRMGGTKIKIHLSQPNKPLYIEPIDSPINLLYLTTPIVHT